MAVLRNLIEFVIYLLAMSVIVWLLVAVVFQGQLPSS